MSSLTKSDAKQIRVQLADGRLAEAEIRADGHLYVTRILPPPENKQKLGGKGTGPGESKPKPQEQAGSVEPDPPLDRVFVEQLKSVLTDNLFDRVVRHRLRGKLDLRSLPSAAQGRMDIFRRKHASKNKAYNVVLVVDESGSMNGPNIKTASTVASFLAQHFEAMDGLNLSIVGFGNTPEIQREWDDRGGYGQLKRHIVDGIKRLGGANSDLAALRLGYQKLSEQPTGRNILVYFSDGGPSEQPPTLTAEMDKHPEVATISLGIGEEGRDIAGHHRLLVEDVATLKPQLLTALRHYIRRGE